LASRVVQLDALALPAHYYLDAADVCYFAGEYTAGAGHAFSETNQLILNFKKSVEKRGSAQWQYKERAIEQAAALLRGAIRKDLKITFVPVPPSKAKSDPLYDDRLIRLLDTMCAGRPWERRELVIQSHSTEPAHKSAARPSVDELMANYYIDKALTKPDPPLLCVVDDVLTTGSHFKAVKQLLAEQFPSVPIIGLFIARRVPKSMDLDDFDVL
jgi:hypothetical protein